MVSEQEHFRDNKD